MDKMVQKMVEIRGDCVADVVEKIQKSFVKMVVPKDASEGQIKDMGDAFWAGAFGMMQGMNMIMNMEDQEASFDEIEKLFSMIEAKSSVLAGAKFN